MSLMGRCVVIPTLGHASRPCPKDLYAALRGGELWQYLGDSDDYRVEGTGGFCTRVTVRELERAISTAVRPIQSSAKLRTRIEMFNGCGCSIGRKVVAVLFRSLDV